MQDSALYGRLDPDRKRGVLGLGPPSNKGCGGLFLVIAPGLAAPSLAGRTCLLGVRLARRLRA
eukprot:3784206-Lingulodinium_polyedra.AAC.1